MWRFWYFDVSLWSVDKKSRLSKLSNKCVFTPYCKDWEPIYPLNTFVRLRFPWIQLRFPQTPPKHSPDNPMASLRNMTCQQTPTDTAKDPKKLTGAVWESLAMFLGICCCLLAFHFPWGYLGVSGRTLRGVWGYLSGIHGNWRRLNKFGGVYGFSVLAVWRENTILTQPWSVRFLSTDHTETSKYQNRRI